MIGVIRAEVLRAVSSLTFLAVLAMTIMIPVIILSQGGGPDLGVLSAKDATQQVIEALAWAFVTAAFVGAYTVTREYYYQSIERTVVAGGFSRIFWAKMVAGAIVGLALGVLICGIWLVVSFFLLRAEGLVLVLGASSGATICGALIGTVLGGAAGAAIGWIVKNYYIGAALVIAVPIGLEYAMSQASPELARFMPGMTLAALGGATSRGSMLAFPEALGLALLWVTLLIVVARLVSRRRFG